MKQDTDVTKPAGRRVGAARKVPAARREPDTTAVPAEAATPAPETPTAPSVAAVEPVLTAAAARSAAFDGGFALLTGFGAFGQLATDRMLRNAEIGLDAGRSLLACHSPEDVWHVQADLMRMTVEAAAEDWAKMAEAAGEIWSASVTPLRHGIGTFPPSET